VKGCKYLLVLMVFSSGDFFFFYIYFKCGVLGEGAITSHRFDAAGIQTRDTPHTCEASALEWTADILYILNYIVYKQV
jgi:hypothetical protein